MKKVIAMIMFFGLLVSLAPVAAVAATVGGDEAWFNIHCNVDGASVYFDSDYKGETYSNILTVPVYTTATPYKTITVEKNGYGTWSQDISGYPAAGETQDIYATLNPVPTPLPTLIGGDVGYYTVYCNVDGASVYFNDDYKGVTSNGELTVQVYTTATPYTTYTVKKDGYTSFTSQITDYPSEGDTVKLHATLTPETTPTSTPISVLTVISGLFIAVLGFAVFSRKN
ncbi:hypothetical protein J2128_000954 [Methanomicrobium sp. W14]|uniref:PEGA domain-containing protein n=1 Tax=Methanomicrobium sp. W14 TaxID=2817839 RepID=UPI001AEB4324|nr:PEGA domain-containing protein [Methanomicrobium sp. W14]MBP2133033.1 hypothetical protein [Methanomicrobium sp. W14]